ncbi:formate--tetrahydrofolate ligase [Propionibacterium sp.]|uniref:formate--tetrahydrofolate ligase n=1 Tax=Propionibacterium sp. TaxID=1977903 RepID=UPI0039ED8727
MKSDAEIARDASLLPISRIASDLGIDEDEYEPYGRDKAKLSLRLLDRLAGRPDGKLILVTAINPTPAGEGKTTTNVGLSMALNRIGHKAVCTLREPSLGPCFGMKGGAAGGGYSQVLPMDDINLHFTGDFHAIGAAHNLLAAMLDNSMFRDNPLGIDSHRIVLRRVLDMNDRELRSVVIGLGRRSDGVPRQGGFEITVASEVMAILCMTSGMDDLKARLGRMIPAYTFDREPVTAADLEATGAMAMLLKDAIKPNLVQTTENTPAIIHGGPFANIAHGCNSVLATRMGLKLADYTVTEAGFGADLGAEKFLDIVCPTAGFAPDAVVLVATVRALKYNAGVSRNELGEENLAALGKGIANLEQHLGNLRGFGVNVVVALNRFPEDTAAELALVAERCAALGAQVCTSEAFVRGSEGAVELAGAVVETCNQPNSFHPRYTPDQGLREKIETVAREIYHADGVKFSARAERQLANLTRLGFGELPVCLAKTQYSFSDDPHKLGAPRGFTITVRQVAVRAGAGFVVALTGDILTMPGLPKVPAAAGMDVDAQGRVSGLS